MADFNGTVLTDKGRNLLSKALTGTALHFTKVALGDGVWDSSVNPENLDDLVSKKIDLPINNLSVTGDGTAVLRFVLTNSGLTDGFFTREIGIYANDPDLGEILYAVTYSNNPDFIPADGVVKIENVTDIYTVVSNAQNVTAVISDTVVIATKDDVKSLSGVDDSLILKKLKNVDGSGSGLDADKLDGLDSSQFIRSDVDDTANGKLFIKGGISTNKIDFDVDGANSDSLYIERVNNSSDYSELRIHIGDNDGGDDYLSIGASPSGSWHEKFLSK
jgi:phage-related tail fiber protein